MFEALNVTCTYLLWVAQTYVPPPPNCLVTTTPTAIHGLKRYPRYLLFESTNYY